MATTDNGNEHTLLVSSLWLHGGFIGAAIAGAGVLQWCSGDLRFAFAFGLVFSGALVAAACWRRGWVVLRMAMRDMPPLEAASAACHRADAHCAGAHKVSKGLLQSEVA